MFFLAMKAIHIISVICWFAGLFYLPRIFIYHAMDNEKGGASSEMLKTMERKLYFYITTPAMISTWIFGLVMLFSQSWVIYSSMGWLHMTLMLVVILTIYHFSMGYYLKKFKTDSNKKSHKFFRFYNEMPTILLIVIVLLVVLKPF